MLHHVPSARLAAQAWMTHVLHEWDLERDGEARTGFEIQLEHNTQHVRPNVRCAACCASVGLPIGQHRAVACPSSNSCTKWPPHMGNWVSRHCNSRAQHITGAERRACVRVLCGRPGTARAPCQGFCACVCARVGPLRSNTGLILTSSIGIGPILRNVDR